ncbi:unnamed protein product [Ilex paraguariensis]|uniref:Uncharacterized protein n=1 Tax=Ilex paraguariensis TaxID=185542 RepID=A0ABC8UFN0_9AQUA
MAVRCYPSPTLMIQNSSSIKKPVRRALMLAQSHVSDKNTSLLQFRSSCKIKVFEDHSKGVVCYRDDNGEITCEGFDEGPRLHQQFSIVACNTRDAEIIDLLQRCWLQVTDSSDQIESAEEGVGGQTGFNQNGFNPFF